MVGEAGSCFVVDDPEGAGVLVEVVDGEEVTRPLSWPDGEEAGLPAECAVVGVFVHSPADIAIGGYFDVAHRLECVREHHPATLLRAVLAGIGLIAVASRGELGMGMSSSPPAWAPVWDGSA